MPEPHGSYRPSWPPSLLLLLLVMLPLLQLLLLLLPSLQAGAVLAGNVAVVALLVRETGIFNSTSIAYLKVTLLSH